MRFVEQSIDDNDNQYDKGIADLLNDLIENHAEDIDRLNLWSVYEDIENFACEGNYYGVDYCDAVVYFTELLYSNNIDPLQYMKYVPPYFLNGSKMKEITIPKNITRVYELAFAESSIETIIIEGELREFASDVFAGSDLKKIICKKLDTFDYLVNNKHHLFTSKVEIIPEF